MSARRILYIPLISFLLMERSLSKNSLYFGIFNTTFLKQVNVHNRNYETEKERNLFYSMLTHNNNRYFGKCRMQAIKKNYHNTV